MKKLFPKRLLPKNFWTFAMVIAAFVVIQYMDGQGMLKSAFRGQLIPICCYIVLAVSLNLVVGISGELSLGHAGFMGVGAFTGIVVASMLELHVENEILRLILAMLAGGVLSGLAGALIGVPVLRLRGDYLAIVTLAFGEILKNIIGNLYIGMDANGLHFAFKLEKLGMEPGGVQLLSGPMGATGIDRISTFPMGFALILVTLVVVLNLVNSKEGRAIMAIRDNRIAAESVGLNVFSFKMKAFVISAALAGMAGALYGLNFSAVQASKFNFNTSINILVFVVLGGMGNIGGSVIAAALLYMLPELLRELYDYRMIMYAVILILVMLFSWSPMVKNLIETAASSRFFKRLHGRKEDG